MGIEDRDWYREESKAKEKGLTGRYRAGGDRAYPHPPISRSKPPLHPVWCVFLFVAICLGVFLLLKLLSMR